MHQAYLLEFKFPQNCLHLWIYFRISANTKGAGNDNQLLFNKL